ncbi:hypothetical protein GCM10025734_42190 [Kitasatospora paranensis]
MRVIGAIAMRLGTVRPFSATGRERISAAREAEDAVTVMEFLAGTGRYVHVHACVQMPTVPAAEAFRPPGERSCDPGHAAGVGRPERGRPSGPGAPPLLGSGAAAAL